MTRSTSSHSMRTILHPRPRRVVHGHKLPDDHPPLTTNERAWIEMLRVIAGDADPPPTLPAVQALRRALTE